jgi:hypothetical protein
LRIYGNEKELEPRSLVGWVEERNPTFTNVDQNTIMICLTTKTAVVNQWKLGMEADFPTKDWRKNKIS